MVKTINVGGCLVDLFERQDAIAVILDRIRDTSTDNLLVVTSVNLDHIYHFGVDRREDHLLECNSAEVPDRRLDSMNLIDGVPVRLAASLLARRRVELIAGSDVLPEILSRMSEERGRVAFIGGPDSLRTKFEESMRVDYGGLEFVGLLTPPRSTLLDDEGSAEVAAQIASWNADLLVVGFGKPFQEEWISRYANACDAKVVLAFGAATEFLVGHKQRSPIFLRRSGLEWLHRLILEPRRLRRRYLLQGPRALAQVISSSRSRCDLGDSKRSVRRSVLPPATAIVVVVTFNNAGSIEQLFESIDCYWPTNVERVVCVDNRSRDDTVERVRKFERVTVIETGQNAGYAAAINRALQTYRKPGQHAVVLNPDVQLTPDLIDRLLLKIASDPSIGIVFPKMLDGDGTVYQSIRREPTLPRAVRDALLGASRFLLGLSEVVRHDARYNLEHDVDWSTGAALAISGQCLDIVGQWDEQYFLYSEEVDYCRRARDAGFRVVYDPSAVITHERGGSGSSLDLSALLEINKIRYAYSKRAASGVAMYLVKVLHHALRVGQRSGFRRLLTVAGVSRWGDVVRTLKRG